jgi:hypothetical protein
MSDSFTLPGGSIVAEVNVDQIQGTGGVASPMLFTQPRVDFHGPGKVGRALHFRDFCCRVSPFNGTYIATSSPASVNVLVRDSEHFSNNLIHLEIPLDQARLAMIERERQGGDVTLRLDCQLLVDELIEVGNLKENPNPWVWGFRKHHRLEAQIQVVVPKSMWIERVLPQTGYGQMHILELPAIPIEQCSGLREAFQALQQAQKLERQGNYVESIGTCRKALEPFFEYVDETDDRGENRKIPVLKRSWEHRICKDTYYYLNSSL